MNAIRRFALAAALVFGAALPASALPVAAPVGVLFSTQMAASGRAGVEAGAAAAESYFDFDALITLGALALAGGGLVAFAARAAERRKREDGEPEWRESVFRSVQADLAKYSQTFRHAA